MALLGIGGLEMTKEQKEKALAFLKDMQECTYDGVEEIRTAIECLEQQPCDDCVSRQAVAEIINKQRFGIHQISMGIIKEKIESLPSVTPTHGTCDDCHYSKEKNNFQICTKYHEIVKRHGFYCADYEK